MSKQIADGVEIEWRYRPDDRSKQGKTETVARDLAAMHVRDGVAVYAGREPFVSSDGPDGDEPAGEQSSRSARKSAVPVQRGDA